MELRERPLLPRTRVLACDKLVSVLPGTSAARRGCWTGTGPAAMEVPSSGQLPFEGISLRDGSVSQGVYVRCCCGTGLLFRGGVMCSEGRPRGRSGVSARTVSCGLGALRSCDSERRPYWGVVARGGLEELGLGKREKAPCCCGDMLPDE